MIIAQLTFYATIRTMKKLIVATVLFSTLLFLPSTAEAKSYKCPMQQVRSGYKYRYSVRFSPRCSVINTIDLPAYTGENGLLELKRQNQRNYIGR